MPGADDKALSQPNEFGPSDPDALIECWCGAKGTAAELFDDALFEEPCGGSGVLHCYCGGDLCICHNHGSVECPGCADCRSTDDDDEADYCGDNE